MDDITLIVAGDENWCVIAVNWGLSNSRTRFWSFWWLINGGYVSNMYIYIYTHTHTHTYTYTSTYTYTYTYIYTMFTYIHWNGPPMMLAENGGEQFMDYICIWMYMKTYESHLGSSSHFYRRDHLRFGLRNGREKNWSHQPQSLIRA